MPRIETEHGRKVETKELISTINTIQHATRKLGINTSHAPTKTKTKYQILQ